MTFAERHDERAAGRRDTHPLAFAGAPEKTPDDHHIIAECLPDILGRKIGEGREVSLLIGTANRVPALAAEAQRLRVQETVFDESVEDPVVVPRELSVPVTLEQTPHLLRTHCRSIRARR